MKNEVLNNDNLLADKQQSEEKGASLVEYALLVALIAVICLAALTILGEAVSQQFSTIASII